MINCSSPVFRICLLLAVVSTLTACVWWRLYQTKMQIDEFDRYFSVEITDQFILHFKQPVIYREDFNTLSKLLPSSCKGGELGKICHYQFYQVKENKQRIIPEVQFYFALSYNQNDRLSAWAFSPVFLQIAPAEFLEASLRSLGGARINRSQHQLKANAHTIKRISAKLPTQADVLEHLGRPLHIEQEPGLDVFIYHFLLATPKIEPGYEARALSIIRLTFDIKTQELVKMKGSFAGLKIAIDYRKYSGQHKVQLDAQAGMSAVAALL